MYFLAFWRVMSAHCYGCIVWYVSCMHKCAIIFHGPPYRFAHLTQSLLRYSVVNVGSSATATAVLICLAISYTTTAHVELCAAIQSACTEIEWWTAILNKCTQARDVMEKALQEDPSVFEYDAVYDEMENKKRESDPRLKSQEERKVSIPWQTVHVTKVSVHVTRVTVLVTTVTVLLTSGCTCDKSDCTWA